MKRDEIEPDYEGIARIKLNARQAAQLVELYSVRPLVRSDPRANVRALNALEKLGFVVEIKTPGERAWQITETGLIRCTSIY
jgi:hypothetical protein